MTNNKIQSITIYKSEAENIFSLTDKTYQIPLYQRAYAWEDEQIEQLIEDISDAAEDSNYYLGSLVVADKGQYYEVIDGQQRLTTLMLLLYCIDKDGYDRVKTKLRFACREMSNYTLDNLDGIMNKVQEKDAKNIQESIVAGVKIISHKLKAKCYKCDDFVAKLGKVLMYRIVVPEHTDLNRYFETMNTRGEQLELHDILKAQLMSKLNNDREQENFAKIWDACSDMHGYVQMNFSRRDREFLFGSRWQSIPDDALNGLKDSSNPISREDYSIAEIISGTILDSSYKSVDSENVDIKIRFESIIEFPHFLIHAIKVFEQSGSYSSMIDDRKLMEYFKPNDRDEEFSKRFINHLLRMRMLFDKYIIKREYLGDSKDGEWSLKMLDTSGQQGGKKPYFKKTEGFYDGESHKSVIMIQSALRVSYTSPKVMHWITRLLEWLNKNSTNQKIRLTEFCLEAERIAQDSIKGYLEKGDYCLGVATPHIVFNYLDYLLWKDDQNIPFVFEFRNSVEHWYPQNPSTTEIPKWDDVNRFGNLCLIQRNVNSRFSNLRPTGKKESYKEMIKKSSLKLRKMSDYTKDDISWRDCDAEIHEKDMIGLLTDACKLPRH